MHVIRDLQYISIQQCIDTQIEYHMYCIMILCSMNIEMPDSAEQCMFHVVSITYVFKFEIILYLSHK